MHLEIYKLICVKLSVMIDTTKLYGFILVCMTLTLSQGYCDVRKQKLLYHLSHKVLNGFLMESGMVLRLAGLMSLIHVLSLPINIQGRDPNLDDFEKKSNL